MKTVNRKWKLLLFGAMIALILGLVLPSAIASASDGVASVHVVLWNDDNPPNGTFDSGEEITPAEDPSIKVEVSGKGQFQTCQNFEVPLNTTVTYRFLRGSIYGPWLTTSFSASGDWLAHFATVHITLWNDDNKNSIFDSGEEITTAEDGAIKVEVSGVGQLVTCDTIHLPPGTQISYRLLRGSIYGPWQTATFSAGYIDWKLEFATVHITLWNDDSPQNNQYDSGEDITTDEDGAIKVEVSGVSQLVTCNTIHLPPGTEISYRLLRGSISGPWQKTTFSAGYTDWQLEFATVHITLWNDDSPSNGKFDTGEEITPVEDPNIKVEVSGVGQLVTCNTIHLPPGTEISYRLLRGGIYGPWQKTTFSAGYTDWLVHFATVHVTIVGPGIVEVSGVGQLVTCNTIHLPPDTTISYRLKAFGEYSAWQTQTFPAGFTEWRLEVPVEVVLFNDTNGNGKIDAAEKIGDPHRVQVSGSGDYRTGDTIPWSDLPASGRLHSGGIYGAWQTMDPAGDDGTNDGKLELEFATVHVTLYNDSNENNQIEDNEKLTDPHKVQVSGSGDYVTCNTFHVPPGTDISYRLHSGGIYGSWQKQSFIAGYTDWQLEFATVHVTLYNGDETLTDPYKVQVSGSGDYVTCNTFHVPPGTDISYRLHSGGIYGAWQKQSFIAGYTDWKLEFATVHVTLYNDSNKDGKIDEGEKLGDPHKVQVSGSGDYITCNTFHVPPNTDISYRLHSGGIYGSWQKQTFSAGMNGWQLEFATVHVNISQPNTSVQVSGSGDYITCNTFHVPPNTDISYRLHSGGIYGAWQKRTFLAGYTDWVLP